MRLSFSIVCCTRAARSQRACTVATPTPTPTPYAGSSTNLFRIDNPVSCWGGYQGAELPKSTMNEKSSVSVYAPTALSPNFPAALGCSNTGIVRTSWVLCHSGNILAIGVRELAGPSSTTFFVLIM